MLNEYTDEGKRELTYVDNISAVSMSDAQSKPVSSASRYVFSTLAMEVTRTHVRRGGDA
jgi:hypothetical protein